VLSNRAFRDNVPSASMPERKAHALATMRHEMAHATHYELAIAWLAMWRDDWTNERFDAWLGGKLFDPTEYAWVQTGINLNKRATELFAFAEDFVTGIPFLPPTPSYALVQKQEDWPTALRALDGFVRNHQLIERTRTITKADAQIIQSEAMARIHRAVCDPRLTASHRAALVSWLTFVHDPSTVPPLSPSDISAKALLIAVFANDVVKDVLATAQKPCP